jgi:hypothetical protein
VLDGEEGVVEERRLGVALLDEPVPDVEPPPLADVLRRADPRLVLGLELGEHERTARGVGEGYERLPDAVGRRQVALELEGLASGRPMMSVRRFTYSALYPAAVGG